MNYTRHNKFYNRIPQLISNIFPNLKLLQIIKKIQANPALISHTYTYLSHLKQKRLQITGLKYTLITNKTHRIWIRSLSGVYRQISLFSPRVLCDPLGYYVGEML